MNVSVTVPFPSEDYDWLRRTAIRRGVREMDVINQLFERENEATILITRPSTPEEVGQRWTQVALRLVRKARLEEM